MCAMCNTERYTRILCRGLEILCAQSAFLYVYKKNRANHELFFIRSDRIRTVPLTGLVAHKKIKHFRFTNQNRTIVFLVNKMIRL